MDNKEQIEKSIYKTVRKPVKLVSGFNLINEPKAELLTEMLEKMKVVGKTLIIADEETFKNSNLRVAVEKSDNAEIVLVNKMESKDVLAADSLLITDAALKDVSERLSKQ